MKDGEVMENIVFMVSTLNLYYKDENENRIAINFGNENNILDNLKKYIKKNDNFLFVASNETNIEATDKYAKVTFESFEKTLPFNHYKILDIRTEENAKELIENADLIFLCGGHLPHQNEFFNNINLKQLLENASGVIIGQSAGAMNCAKTVYVAPELDGESIDPKFEKHRLGLGLSDINVLPHYNFFKEYILDGKNYIEDIIIPDSYETSLVALIDGSYILIENGKYKLFGTAYSIVDGNIKLITDINETLVNKK